jgi:hypothetical protein
MSGSSSFKHANHIGYAVGKRNRPVRADAVRWIPMRETGRAGGDPDEPVGKRTRGKTLKSVQMYRRPLARLFDATESPRYWNQALIFPSCCLRATCVAGVRRNTDVEERPGAGHL